MRTECRSGGRRIGVSRGLAAKAFAPAGRFPYVFGAATRFRLYAKSIPRTPSTVAVFVSFPGLIAPKGQEASAQGFNPGNRGHQATRPERAQERTRPETERAQEDPRRGV